ncbi:hypothetical protein BJ741DRAFT_709159 [Chytriomyces cf. hyalinus JEL632]|nr:hypothetical protein BJ741DRAFT_709159 [Chytriomyces cf. hyalinus JEL632]
MQLPPAAPAAENSFKTVRLPSNVSRHAQRSSHHPPQDPFIDLKPKLKQPKSLSTESLTPRKGLRKDHKEAVNAASKHSGSHTSNATAPTQHLERDTSIASMDSKITESKAEENSRLLSQISATRAENETARLLSISEIENSQNLAEQVTQHLKDMQNFMASKLKTRGIFSDGGVLGVDRLVEAERKTKMEAVALERRQYEDMKAELNRQREAEDALKKTGKGRRQLALASGGTGEIPVSFMTSRADFRPIPDISHVQEGSSDANLPHPTIRPDIKQDEEIFEALGLKLESAKLQIQMASQQMQAQPTNNENSSTKAHEYISRDSSTSESHSSSNQKYGKAFDPIDALLSRGVSAAVVRRASGKPIPRVPLDVAALWKAKDDGRFNVDHTDKLRTHPVDANKTKHRRDIFSSGFVSFGESSDLVGLRKVLDKQNAEVHKLAEEVLGPFERHPAVVESIPDVQENILDQLQSDGSQPTKISETLAWPTNFSFINESSHDDAPELRKLQPPPVPVVMEFPFSSARLLDARNRRINPKTSNDIIQPKLRTNMQSLKMQSSIHNISQPPSISMTAFAGSSKVADACLKNQFKMAPTLSIDVGPCTANPEVELPQRSFVGTLGEVFGIEDALMQSSVSQSILNQMGVKSTHARTKK